MFEVREKPQMVERALLVRLYFDPRDEEESEALLEELGELVRTVVQLAVGDDLTRSRHHVGRMVRTLLRVLARPAHGCRSRLRTR